MCVRILTVWTQLHFVFFAVSMDLKNDIAKSYINKNGNESHINKEVIINQDHKNIQIVKQNRNGSEKIQLKIKNEFYENMTDEPEKNDKNFTTPNAFLVINTEKRKQFTNKTFVTKLSFNIFKLNQTNKDYANNASYRRHYNMTHELDIFLYNKSRSEQVITPYSRLRKDNKLGNIEINKESNRNILKRNDNNNSLNIYKVTKENKVRLGEKEYSWTKPNHNSISRAHKPKIERYRLGDFHLDHEVEIFSDKTSMDPEIYTTMFFDSDEDVTMNPVLTNKIQNNHIDDVNYKTPRDAFETRDKKPIDVLTTTMIARLTTRKTTGKPFRSELHQERVLMKMGPFTFFIYKLMEFLAMKRPSRLMKELTDQFLDVSLQLFQERSNLVEFGQPFRLGVIDFFTNIRTYEADTLQKMASIFHKALPKRWELFHVLVNVLYERIDQLYRQSEIHILSNLLEDLKNYPNTRKNSTQLVRSILVDAVVNPFTREGKTSKRLEMLARLNAYISFAFYGGRYLDVPDFNEANEPPSNSGLTDSLTSSQSFDTTSMNNVTESYDKIFDNVTQEYENSVFQDFEKVRTTIETPGIETSSVSIKQTTRAVGRSASKNINEQEGDIITDEEDILKKRLYRGSHALQKFEFQDDDMLSSYLKYVSKHESPKFTKKREKNKIKHIKPSLPQSINITRKIHHNENNNGENKGRSNVIFEFIDKSSSSTGKSFSIPANLGNMWKEVLETNKSRNKNIEKKGLSRKRTDRDIEITELKVTPKLEGQKLKYKHKSKSFNHEMLHSSTISKKSSENILRKKVEIYNDTSHLINRNIDSHISTKTTDSFLDLLLKLDELVNSGERGVLDEILNTDDTIKDSTFQKIEAENEKFLEKEAAVNIVLQPAKIHTSTKDSSQSEMKYKVESQYPEHGVTYENIKFTKGYVEEILENTVKIEELESEKVQEIVKSTTKYTQYQLETSVKSKSGEYQKFKQSSDKKEKHHSDATKSHKFQQHAKEAIRSNQNYYIKHNSSANRNNINMFTKDEETTENYTKKKNTNKEQSDHKSDKIIKLKSRNFTKNEFYLQTQMNYVDEQSKEISNSYTFNKPNLKSVTFRITRKPSTEYKDENYYLTKKILRELKEDHTKKKKSGKVQKVYAQSSKSFKNYSKTTASYQTTEYTKDRVKMKLVKKDFKKVDTSKTPVSKTTAYYTMKKSQKVTKKHNFTEKSVKEIHKELEQRHLISAVKRFTKRISKSVSPTERNSEEVFENHSHKSKKLKHRKYQARKINEQVKKYSQVDYDSSSNNVKKTMHENVVNSIEEVLSNLKKAVTRYRPSERINKDFIRKKKEKIIKTKQKHSKKYRPVERIAGNVKLTKKEHKKIKLRNQKRTGETNEKSDEDIDNSIVWNPAKSTEGDVKQNSDDYYIIQGGGKSKIFFQDDEKRYEVKQYKEEPKVKKKNLSLNSFNPSHKKNYSMKIKKTKSDDYLKARENYKNLTTTSNLKPRKRSKGNLNKEKDDSSELTELLDEVIDQDSAGEDDFDAPINEYTLKPVHNLNKENVVFTTTGIFEELKQLKNRLFHQNFRRGMNRKHKITLNELFLKKRSNVKKIIEESSYSDDEHDLKQKLQDALLQARGKDVNHRMRSENTTEINKNILLNVNLYKKINEVSDSVDEELLLKSNIYKGLGLKEFN